MKKGLVQIYTGDGKGKTTAAVGLALRALGHGLKVYFIYFHKDINRWGYGEIGMLRKAGADVRGFACAHPHFDKNISDEKIRTGCSQALAFVRGAMKHGNYDLIILDEILISVRDGYIKEQDIISLMRTKPRKLELVLTGRSASPKLILHAQLVSKIKNVKHPYQKGVSSRKGIEF